jgi:predicted AlkP superfamily phosphohydrolase/phosphomutase
MPARVVLVGMDAADATLIDRWVGEGALPEFAALSAPAARVRLANPLETLPGGIWPELMTGRPCGDLGLFYHPLQLRTGEARPRRVAEHEIDPRAFWTVASDAGARVAVADVPQAAVARGLNGVHLIEWGPHDSTFDPGSEPREFLAEIRARHGDHPVPDCDAHDASETAYEDLLARLVAGAERKTAMLLDVLGRERWDLFACAFSETHCGGHQFWHFQDPASPRHPAHAPASLRAAVATIYRAVTTGVARLVEAAGPDAVVLVVASHGMGLYTGGPQLLTDVLVRLGMLHAPEREVRARLPYAFVRGFRAAVPVAWRRRLHAAVERLPQPLESSATRAVALENNRCGAIRLNLRGREPFGSVEPGRDADELVAELRRELGALRHPETGEPIVVCVKTAGEALGPERHPDVPDLIVVFRDDIGPIEACVSERVGLVSVPLHKPHLPRTGDHRGETRVWALGRGTDGLVSTGRAIDVAPTVLALLGIPVPSWMRGRPLAK